MICHSCLLPWPKDLLGLSHLCLPSFEYFSCSQNYSASWIPSCVGRSCSRFSANGNDCSNLPSVELHWLTQLESGPCHLQSVNGARVSHSERAAILLTVPGRRPCVRAYIGTQMQPAVWMLSRGRRLAELLSSTFCSFRFKNKRLHYQLCSHYLLNQYQKQPEPSSFIITSNILDKLP